MCVALSAHFSYFTQYVNLYVLTGTKGCVIKGDDFESGMMVEECGVSIASFFFGQMMI